MRARGHRSHVHLSTRACMLTDEGDQPQRDGRLRRRRSQRCCEPAAAARQQRNGHQERHNRQILKRSEQNKTGGHAASVFQTRRADVPTPRHVAYKVCRSGSGRRSSPAPTKQFRSRILCEQTLLRGTTVNSTYGTHKNLFIYLFLLTIFGPIYYGPP